MSVCFLSVDESNEQQCHQKDKGEHVEPPIGTEEFTFLPGCCAKVSSCRDCDATKASVQRPTELVNKALSLNMTSTVNISSYCSYFHSISM
jgi:hypothetical protein